MKGFQIRNPSQGEYLHNEAMAEDHGLLSLTDNPQGNALEAALANRRQKLAEKKIGLYPDPEDISEQ